VLSAILPEPRVGEGDTPTRRRSRSTDDASMRGRRVCREAGARAAAPHASAAAANWGKWTRRERKECKDTNEEDVVRLESSPKAKSNPARAANSVYSRGCLGRRVN
jgi:hypothetical protein